LCDEKSISNSKLVQISHVVKVVERDGPFAAPGFECGDGGLAALSSTRVLVMYGCLKPVLRCCANISLAHLAVELAVSGVIFSNAWPCLDLFTLTSSTWTPSIQAT
jgi:hypothetical protein